MNNGGAAFPRPVSQLSPEEIANDQEGMNLRDYFAAHALVAIQVSSGYEQFDAMAKGAYKLADAMLKARVSSS